MPEKEPLQSLAALKVIFEAKNVLGVIFLEEIEKFGGRFHDGERRGLVVV